MAKSTTPKPFIYYEDLKNWEIVNSIIYFILTIGVVLACSFFDRGFNQLLLLFYWGITDLSLYFFLYRSLRNFRSYMVWFGFGIVHLILFAIFKDDPKLKLFHGQASWGLINTIPLLLLYQLLRYFSFNIQHREFVVPSKAGTTDLIENVKVTFVDKTILIIYMLALIGLATIEMP
ncbi:hypothetical protein ACFGVS_26160 [Mucilaginibacter sp. AW1-7]|uniref:hypothetical protein n=1 Tax=unclassified Mucilaginibacter TaxID=2617802 RepID=UPI00236560F7|nr:hypothetical protein [Mucilaginibacter sp. KACC 22773]WDF76548.1 hypothetical protein PQ469_21915 [Mucilaginibacter sp. KACC 22773]